MLRGKGYFVWQLERSGASDASVLAKRAKDAGLEHVLIKIADGVTNFPIDNPSMERFTGQVIDAFKSNDILVGGWGFFYGGTDRPQEEQAKRFAARLKQFDLDEAIVNAENIGSRKWTGKAARTFMQTLLSEVERHGLEQVTYYLSSYRYIRYHSEFPFDEFMESCHAAMPQVYWAAKNGGDPIKNLQESFEDYSSRYPTKAFIPTGATFGETMALGTEKFYWEAAPDQITMFLNQAKAMNFPAVNFWSWQEAWEKRGLWNAVAAYPYSVAARPSGGEGDRVDADPSPTIMISDLSIGDDGIAVIFVNSEGYQQGVYNNNPEDGLTMFVRQNKNFSFTPTTQSRSTSWAQWVPVIEESGEYLIEAWIPGINATTRRARYHITGVVGQESTLVVELNQLQYADEWAALGLFQLDKNRPFSGMVSINNLTPGDSNPEALIAFGPMRWRKIERKGTVPEGFCDGFDHPIGTAGERVGVGANGNLPGKWFDANPYLNLYELGYHTGSDFNLNNPEYDLDRGAPAYAVADGVVIYSGKAFNRDGSQNGFGTLVVIKHDPYLSESGQVIQAYSRYGHMKDLAVQKGQRVRRGDVVGKIWNNGTKAHHLHFDISLTGILESFPTHWPGSRRSEVEKHYVDPVKFIAKYRPKI